jgi:hypothetical protein
VVDALFALPDACRGAPAFTPVLAAAGDKLQAELGDVDAAMRDGAARERLLSLPLESLCVLLRDARTRASCEDAVLAVASAWHHARRGGGGQGLGDTCRAEAARALAGVVRLGRLSPMAAATVAPKTEWLMAVVSLEELLAATAFAAGDGVYKDRVREEKGGVAARRPEWFKPRRPRSVVTKAKFEVEVTAEVLEAAAQRVLAGSAREELSLCPPLFFRGFQLCPKFEARKMDDGVCFGAFLHVADEGHFAKGAGQGVRCKATFCARRAREHAFYDSMAPAVGACQGWRDFWELGVQKGWDAAAWSAKGLLLEGGKVRVAVTVEADPEVRPETQR